MFKKKDREQSFPMRPVIQQAEELEEDYEMQEEPVMKKKEMSIRPKVQEEPTEEELTEEAVKQILTNLSYRLGRIEHYLRLDY